MRTMELKSDKQLAKTMPPSTDEQREQLVKSLLTESCQEPLIVYKSMIMET